MKYDDHSQILSEKFPLVYMHIWCTMYCMHRQMPGMFVAVYICMRVNEFLDSVPGAVWVFMEVFMTSGSGKVDI